MEQIFYFSLNWILKIVGLLFLGLFFFSIFSEAANYKKSKEIKVKSLGLFIALALVMLFILDRSYGLNLAPGAKWIYYGLLPIIGVAIGFISGSRAKIIKQGDKILGAGNIWHLVFWGLSIIAIQFMALFELSSGINAVKAAVIASTAILVSDNLMIIIKSNKLK